MFSKFLTGPSVTLRPFLAEEVVVMGGKQLRSRFHSFWREILRSRANLYKPRQSQISTSPVRAKSLQAPSDPNLYKPRQTLISTSPARAKSLQPPESDLYIWHFTLMIRVCFGILRLNSQDFKFLCVRIGIDLTSICFKM